MTATTQRPHVTAASPTRRAWTPPRATCFEVRAEITAYAGSVGSWTSR